MSRDATLYWKSRRSDRIGSELVCHAFRFEITVAGIYYNYSGAHVGWDTPIWVPYNALKSNLATVARLYEALFGPDDQKEASQVESQSRLCEAHTDVLAMARPRAGTCEFCLIAEDMEGPPEVEAYHVAIWTKADARRHRMKTREEKESARMYRQVKAELREKFKNQWK